MGQYYKHPLRIASDDLKRAFSASGFHLFDNGEFAEMEDSDTEIKLFSNPAQYTPIYVQNSEYKMRTSLLTSSLPRFKGDLPIRAAACGRVYNEKDELYPVHTAFEGVYADRDLTEKDLKTLWNTLVKRLFGIGAEAQLTKAGKDSYEIRLDGEDYILGYTGKAALLAKELLGTNVPGTETYVFSIDVDSYAVNKFGLASRDELFSNNVSFLKKFTDDTPSFSQTFSDRVTDILRSMGFNEIFGDKLYEAGIYKKMNMIQETWDTNNVGVQLVKPLNGRPGLPTVGTPAVEQACADNWHDGEKEAKIFEISHIFKPVPGGAPSEKLNLSLCCYSDEYDLRSFLGFVSAFLNRAGISNHYFIPNDIAIAYKSGECMLLLDEKKMYLDGNCGGVSEKAEINFGIEHHCYMLHIEIPTFKAKAEEEYRFVPYEDR